ncbi:conserved protein of unknown function (plasmid) [Cupriavidus taiwanensis]|uniref:Uncharacterized protein n=3 Tax=Cupriavidus TaxID=106589 RepID=A0A375HTK7_9BURK|nr:conserved exported hypothetical protein [Cupriavidus taiwanensis]SPD37268.1 conserved protein of unknown function [Cupriavidus taiwanensis]SPD61551.1 conserved protein of unknown function [Cupriavidus taiwanensis]SPD62262.1 conserved protein of unknown function [Cupriavidus neocaledonicus]SPD69381.1 conserved protein of unknown function [Cupriavidus taiwanensis]
MALTQSDKSMALRISKTLMVVAIALFASLVAFNNITDYFTNFVFIRHVLLMDTTFPSSRNMYRTITSPILHHVAYVCIITPRDCNGGFLLDG